MFRCKVVPRESFYVNPNCGVVVNIPIFTEYIMGTYREENEWKNWFQYIQSTSVGCI